LCVIPLIACGKANQDHAPTWTRDVRPIVEQHCVRCHNANGTGVGNFQDFSTISAFAAVMLEKINVFGLISE
jgi:mono/diheme cytochrome c family protein